MRDVVKCNAVYHWLGVNLEPAIWRYIYACKIRKFLFKFDPFYCHTTGKMEDDNQTHVLFDIKAYTISMRFVFNS